MNNADRIEQLEDELRELRIKQYDREAFISKCYNWLGNILTIGAVVGLFGYVHFAG